MTDHEKIQKLKNVLLRAAGRAGYNGATEKQCWFLAKLTVQEGDDVYEREYDSWIIDTSATFTKSDASAMIDMALHNQPIAA